MCLARTWRKTPIRCDHPPGLCICRHPRCSTVWWFCHEHQTQSDGCLQRKPHSRRLLCVRRIALLWYHWSKNLVLKITMLYTDLVQGSYQQPIYDITIFTVLLLRQSAISGLFITFTSTAWTSKVVDHNNWNELILKYKYFRCFNVHSSSLQKRQKSA